MEQKAITINIPEPTPDEYWWAPIAAAFVAACIPTIFLIFKRKKK